MLALILIEAVLALVALAVHLWPRRVGLQPHPAQIALLLVPAAPPLFAGTWGRIFGVEPGSPSNHPTWIAEVLSVSFYASIAISLAVIVLAKGHRIPAAIFALPQIPLAYLVGLLGVMQITGVWL